MVMGELAVETDVLVIGSGPGGYAAAFRAADHGREVTLVDPAPRPGGVCLYKGCIPSKTFLHAAEIIFDAGRAAQMGVAFDPPKVDLAGLRRWKAGVIQKLADGLASLARGRGIQMLTGHAVFDSAESVRIAGGEVSRIRFRHAVVAVGSQPAALPGIEYRPHGRIMSSTGALALADIPGELLVVGGGYIGLELGTLYAALGSRVTLVEFQERLLPGVDEDLLAPLARRLGALFADIRLGSRVLELSEQPDGVLARIEGLDGGAPRRFDRALVAVGRRPATEGLGLEAAGAALDAQGFIRVDASMRTSAARIYAVGDAVGGLMLAHKATAEGKVAADVICGKPAAFDARAIPAVVYTDPQIAWCGLTEEQARREGVAVEVRRFPWKYSSRAATMGAAEGLTKLLAEPGSGRILGVGIVGRGAEALVAEGVLAVEMGALAEDLAASIHPHPTLSETESEAAELFSGHATHVLQKAAKPQS